MMIDGAVYRCRRDITHLWIELPGGSGTGTVQLRALRIRRGAILGAAGREGFAGRIVGLTAAMVTGRWAEEDSGVAPLSGLSSCFCSLVTK
jgi:hypothetical protein